MTVHLFLKPIDVWLFRDGRPFNREIDHRAASLFPPLPSVIQGAIRTHYIERHGGIPAYLDGKLPEVEQVVGKKGYPPPTGFRISGPFIATLTEDRLTRYFPLPAHTYQAKDSYHLLTPKDQTEVITDLSVPLQLLWPEEETEPQKQEESEGGIWLDEDALLELLTRQTLPTEKTVRGSDLFEREHRLGIDRLDDTLGSEEGAIYQVEFIRPCESVGLYVAVDGLPNWPQSGVLRLGGEGHLAGYQQINPPQALPNQPSDGEHFTLTLLTPTWLEGGWQTGDWSKFVAGSPVAAAVNRPFMMGGFDLARQEQKPARRYVSAGTTYYFTGRTELKQDFLSDNEADGRIGFGQFIIGAWSNEK